MTHQPPVISPGSFAETVLDGSTKHLGKRLGLVVSKHPSPSVRHVRYRGLSWVNTIEHHSWMTPGRQSGLRDPWTDGRALRFLRAPGLGRSWCGNP